MAYLVNYYLNLFWEKISGQSAWSEELAQYFKISSQQVLNNLQQKKHFTDNLWHQKKRRSVPQIFSFYSETDYFIYRQKWFNRYKAFWDIALSLLLKSKGSFCEYGSGIGPVTYWLIKLFPQWQYTLVDLNCPVFSFAKWRFKSNQNVNFRQVIFNKLPLIQQYDVITCKQVLEHVPNPYDLVKHLIDHLKPGGWLYLDYIFDPGKENLAQSAKQRNKVITYLNHHLRPIFSIDKSNPAEGYGLYLKLS